MRSLFRKLPHLLPLLAGLLLLAAALPLSDCSGDDAPVAPADSTGVHDSTGTADSGVAYLDPQTLCHIADERLTEISGIAASRRVDGLYWLHNDSGGEPRLFAVDTLGRTVAVCRLTGASNIDWEDIASVRLGDSAWLYVGDIGDNDKLRDHVTVYRLPEPEVDPAWRDRGISAAPQSALLRYPDGAHDCEALAVSPSDGRLLLLEKNGTSCGVYAADWPGDGREAVLQRIASIRLPFEFSFWRLVTAADMHPDGRRMLLRSYTAVLEYETAAVPPLPAVFDSGAARSIPTPGLQQAEAACYSRDGKDILTTSEGDRPPLLILRRKQ